MQAVLTEDVFVSFIELCTEVPSPADGVGGGCITTLTPRRLRTVIENGRFKQLIQAVCTDTTADGDLTTTTTSIPLPAIALEGTTTSGIDTAGVKHTTESKQVPCGSSLADLLTTLVQMLDPDFLIDRRLLDSIVTLKELIVQQSSSTAKVENEMSLISQMPLNDILILGEGLLVTAVQTSAQQAFFVEKILSLPEPAQLLIQQVIEKHLGGMSDGEDFVDNAAGSAEYTYSKSDSSDQKGSTLGPLDSARSGNSTRPEGVPKLHLEKLISRKMSTVRTSVFYGGGGGEHGATGLTVGSAAQQKYRKGSWSRPGLPICRPKNVLVEYDEEDYSLSSSNGDIESGRYASLKNAKKQLMTVLVEKEELATALEEVKGQLDSQKGEQTTIIRQLKDIQSEQNAEMIETIEKLEMEIASLRSNVEQLEKSNRLAERNFEEENRRRLDEIDVLQAAADRKDILEAQVTKYQERLQQATQIKERSKLLEAQLEESISKQIQLEEEAKTATDIRARLDKYKTRITDMEAELNEERALRENLEFQLNTSKEKEVSSQKTIRAHEKRIAEMTANMDKLEFAAKPSRSIAEATLGTDALLDLETKAQIIRLKQENDSLRRMQDMPTSDDAPSGRIVELENELLERDLLIESTQNSLNSAQARNAELKAELAAATITDDASDAVNNLRSELARLSGIERKYEEIAASLHALYKSKDDLNARLREEMDTNSKLRQEISQGDSADSETLRKEIHYLNSKLSESDRLLRAATNSRMEDRQQSYRELQLLSSVLHRAWLEFWNERNQKESIQQQFQELMHKLDERGGEVSARMSSKKKQTTEILPATVSVATEAGGCT